MMMVLGTDLMSALDGLDVSFPRGTDAFLFEGEEAGSQFREAGSAGGHFEGDWEGTGGQLRGTRGDMSGGR